MKIKVCGMRDPNNLQDLLKLPIDYVGLIFYEKSKRFVDEDFPELNFRGKEKVGVFVNESIEYILEKSQQYDLATIQLHGEESPEFCEFLKRKNFLVIKAFPVNSDFDFSRTKRYEPFCDYFLFDTKGKLPGGNGFAFDWKILEKYQSKIPFFLSGGINKSNCEMLKKLNFKQLYAIDLNSGFEKKPGLKDISLLKKFIEYVRN